MRSNKAKATASPSKDRVAGSKRMAGNQAWWHMSVITATVSLRQEGWVPNKPELCSDSVLGVPAKGKDGQGGVKADRQKRWGTEKECGGLNEKCSP